MCQQCCRKCQAVIIEIKYRYIVLNYYLYLFYLLYVHSISDTFTQVLFIWVTLTFTKVIFETWYLYFVVLVAHCSTSVMKHSWVHLLKYFTWVQFWGTFNIRYFKTFTQVLFIWVTWPFIKVTFLHNIFTFTQKGTFSNTVGQQWNVTKYFRKVQFWGSILYYFGAWRQILYFLGTCRAKVAHLKSTILQQQLDKNTDSDYCKNAEIQTQ